MINKDTIEALISRFNWDTPEIAKKALNRLFSATEKSGSATSRLAMVSASINALAGQYELEPESEDATSLEVIALFLAYASQVARDTTTATATNPAPVTTITGAVKKSKKRRSGWENLKDATPSKPVKNAEVSPVLLDNMALILQMIESMNASK